MAHQAAINVGCRAVAAQRRADAWRHAALRAALLAAGASFCGGRGGLAAGAGGAEAGEGVAVLGILTAVSNGWGVGAVLLVALDGVCLQGGWAREMRRAGGKRCVCVLVCVGEALFPAGVAVAGECSCWSTGRQMPVCTSQAAFQFIRADMATQARAEGLLRLRVRVSECQRFRGTEAAAPTAQTSVGGGFLAAAAVTSVAAACWVPSTIVEVGEGLSWAGRGST